MRFTAAFIADIIFVVALYGHVGAAPNPIVNHTPTLGGSEMQNPTPDVRARVNHTPTLGGSEMQSPTPDVRMNTSTGIVIHPPGPTPLGSEFPHPTPEARDGTVRHPTPQARDGEVLRPIPQARE
ncbi:hypothetical protein K439DRAFT_1637594 [Ramaria rubella]|nr:hypothetical protein K439DRAFT_1637594 [Ramaria rubella]